MGNWNSYDDSELLANWEECFPFRMDELCEILGGKFTAAECIIRKKHLMLQSPVKSEKKKVCSFYALGKGVCSKGDRCSFKHYEGPTPQAGHYRAYLDGRVSFFVQSSVNEKILSLLGEEGSRSYHEILLSYLKDRITAREFYMRLKDLKLLHLVEEIGASLQFKYPKRYTNLMEAIIREKAAMDQDQEVGVNVSHPGTFAGNEINNPKSLQHLDDPKRVKGTNYQNQLPHVTTKRKTASFSGNVNTGKTVRLEEQMKVPDVGLQRYMDGGRLVSSEAVAQSSTDKSLGDTIGNGNIAPATNVREDSTTRISVPGTLSTIRPLEDASSRTIFVANVHFGATKDSLSRHFNKFGEVLKAVIVTDPATGQPSGSAYIEFTRKEAAENALSLDGTSFMSRILKIVKGNNGQHQEAAPSMTWSQAGRFTRGSPSYRRGGAFRGRSIVRAGARTMQWKRSN